MKKLMDILTDNLSIWASDKTVAFAPQIDLDHTGAYLEQNFTWEELSRKKKRIAILRLIGSTLNPLDAIGRLSTIERKGVSKDSKNIIGREVDPRFWGAICPLDTPESEKIGITLHIAHDAEIKDNYLLPKDFKGKKDGIVGQVLTSKLPDGRWLVFKTEPITVKIEETKNEETDVKWRKFPIQWTIWITQEKPEEAIEIPENYDKFLGLSALLVPFIQHNDGARAMMGAKNAKQALPPIDAEPPLVQTGYEEEIAKMFFNLLEKAYPDNWLNVKIRIFNLEKEGPRTYIYRSSGNNIKETTIPDLSQIYVPAEGFRLPTNYQPVRLSGFPAFSIRPRQKVKRDESFFDISGIKDGVLSLGVNALVGYIPFFGYNFEDAIVISESLAKRMTTQHIYTLEIPAFWKWNRELEIDLKRGRITGFYETKKGEEEPRSLTLPSELLSSKKAKILGIFRKTSPRSPWEIWILAEKPVQVGDKLTGRHGNKGVVSRILPDEMMPFFELKGKRYHLEAILNPHGVVSRMNLGQIFETHVGFIIKRLEEMGKVEEAEKWMKTGKPFNRINLDKLSQTLQKVGLDPYGRIEVHIQDPDDPKIKGKVHAVVGYQYFLRLAHLADEKLTARGVSNRRSFITDQPTHGRKKEGGQRIGEMETWALLAHNATNTLRELLFEASDSRSKYFIHTRTLQENYTPKALEALKNLLLSTFIKFEINNNEIILQYLSDAEFKKITSARKIETLNDLIINSPEDPKLDEFGYIELGEELRFVHPWFLNQLIKNKDVKHLLERHSKSEIKEELKKIKKLLKGEAYLVKRNKKWDVEDYKKQKNGENEELKKLNEAHQVLVGWKALKKHLGEENELLEKLRAYSHTILPVAPYRYRLFCESLAVLRRKAAKASYAEMHNLTVGYARILLDQNKNREIPAPKRKRILLRHINILLNKIFSDLLFSKEGIIRNHILGKRIDRSGRAVIVPDPLVPPDRILIPSYLRNKLLQGLGRRQNFRILFNRQPTLHKYSIFSFHHQESPDNTFHISPLICAPYNADFDGDTMAVYLPISHEAQKELENMSFIKHWKSVATGNINLHISQDIKLGFNILNKNLDRDDEPWQTLRQQAVQATEARSINELKKLLEEPQRLIEELMLRLLPLSMKNKKIPLETLFAERLRDLARIAFRSATFSGVTFSIFEVKELQEKFNPANFDFEGAKNELDAWLNKNHEFHSINSPALLVKTRARGKPEQLLQLIFGRKLPQYNLNYKVAKGNKNDTAEMQKNKNQVHLIVKSDTNSLTTPLLTGHNPLEYFTLSFTTRLTMADKKLSVAHAGYLTRKLVHSSFELRITKEDCGTDENSRSPLTCKATDGVCLKCLGDVGEEMEVGDFIGILAATSVGERGTQASMETFHTADPMQGLNRLISYLTGEISDVSKAKERILELKKESNLYKNVREPIIATVFRARLKDGKILNYSEAVNQGDIFARIAFERAKIHITSALINGNGHYKEPIRSKITRLFLLGEKIDKEE